MTSALLSSSFQLSQGDKYIYYILVEDLPYGSKLFCAGSMCYLKEQMYLHYISTDMSSTRIWRFIMVEDGSTVTMNVEMLHPLDKTMADFLTAIASPRERLNCFLEKLALDSALTARVGQRVLIDLDQQTFPGTVRYIGKLRNPFPSGLCPIYFGVELQGDGVGKGHCDGTYNGMEFFKCKPDCGLFLPCNKLQFVAASENNKAKQEEKPEAVEDIPVKVGETVGFYLDDVYTRGVAMAVYKEGGNWMVKVCPEEEGTADVFRDIPMDSVVKEELFSSAIVTDTDGGPWTPRKRERSESPEDGDNRLPSLDVNSVVQIDLGTGNRVTGTIRWIGYTMKAQRKMAGIELDEEKGVCDGEWEGKRYFTCPPKRGLFVNLELCQPDMRFQCNDSAFLESVKFSELDTQGVQSNSPPLRDDLAVHVLQGRMRGIQGHCNSCYMDAALFRCFKKSPKSSKSIADLLQFWKKHRNSEMPKAKVAKKIKDRDLQGELGAGAEDFSEDSDGEQDIQRQILMELRGMKKDCSSLKTKVSSLEDELKEFVTQIKDAKAKLEQVQQNFTKSVTDPHPEVQNLKQDGTEAKGAAQKNEKEFPQWKIQVNERLEVLEVQSRTNNLRIKNVSEDFGKENLKDQLTQQLREYLNLGEEKAVGIENVYRVNSRQANTRGQPRDIFVSFQNKKIRDQLLYKNRSDPLTIGAQDARIFQDLLPELLRKRAQFHFLRQILIQKEIRYFWKIPFALEVILPSGRTVIKTLEEAQKLADSLTRLRPPEPRPGPAPGPLKNGKA